MSRQLTCELREKRVYRKFQEGSYFSASQGKIKPELPATHGSGRFELSKDTRRRSARKNGVIGNFDATVKPVRISGATT
jgi:hypothetical protein